MARMSRLLGAVCLGAAATAAMAAVVVNHEYSPVHRAPKASAESTTSGRVIVKFKATSSTLAAATGTGGAGPRSAHILGAKLGLVMADGRTLGTRTQVLHVKGMSSSALVAKLRQQSDVEWVQVDHKRYIQAAPNDPLYAANQLVATPAVGQWYLHAPDSPFEDSTGLKLVSSINIEPAWAITKGSSSVIIGDVDTGITAHPDIGGATPGGTGSKLFAATFPGTTSATPYGYDFVGYGATDDQYALPTANDGNLADPDPSDPGDWVSATDIANNTLGSQCTKDDEQDSSWHGTQTAGILAAATNNGIGMAGVGYNTKLVPVRALGKCGGYDSDIAAAAEWAGGVLPAGSKDTAGNVIPTNIHPARVVNMSLGGAGTCASDAPVYVDALTALRNNHVIAVVAAGNGDGLAVDIPANCLPDPSDSDQTPIVVGVGGLRHVGDKVGFSNVGPELTISAPGGNCVNTDSSAACLYPILTTSNTGLTAPDANGGTYTTSFGDVSLGTSFSTPMVAGTVALMISAAPNLSNATIISLLQKTARPFPQSGGSAGTLACAAPGTAEQDECYCTTTTCGAGMLDAGRAVAAAVVGDAPTATISAGSSSLVVGNATTLDASSSTGSNGSAITAYQWAIDSTDTVVTLSGTTGASITATAAVAGTAQVELTVTDANGLQSSTSTSIAVTAATVVVTPPATASSGGGHGGGAANPVWLLALAVAGLLLTPRARRRRRG